MSVLTSKWLGWSILGLSLIGWIAGVSALGVGAAAETPGQAKGSSPNVAVPRQALLPGQPSVEGPVESITGTVVRVRSARGRARASGRPAQIRGSQFLLQAQKETVTIRGGPFRYRRRQGFEIHAGDELHVKGWRLRTPGKTIIVAGEIKKGSRVLKLRDDRGRPLWLIGAMRGRQPGRRPGVPPPGVAPKKSGAPSEPADRVR